MDQVERGARGQAVLIEADVGNVAADLRDIDPALRLRYSELGEYFVVYFEPPDKPGDHHLVLTALECDQRIVKRVRQIASADYDYTSELDRIDREVERDKRNADRQRIGEGAERLYHEIRKAEGVRARAYISKPIPKLEFDAPFVGAPAGE